MSRIIPEYYNCPLIGRTRNDAEIAQANSDPLLIRRGLINGASLVHKFGRNPAVPNGSWEGVLQATAQFTWLQAATTVRVKAGGDAADDGTSSPLGAGAQAVTIQGLDATGVQVTETVTTAGTAASAYTTTEFIRVYRAWVSSVGTYTGSNTANIMIEDGTNDLILIAAGEGQTQFCGYSIPAGKTGYLASVLVQADGAKAADFRLFTRENILETSAPYTAKRLKYYWDGVLGVSLIKTLTPILKIPPLTDIWIEAQGGGVGTEVTADMEIVLYDD